MCGIVGYCGEKKAAPVLIAGVKKLEYRGYDSAGIVTLYKGGYRLVKKKGRVEGLGDGKDVKGSVGIGHTRWATHGAPSARNAHPHVFGQIAIVHNGIIENAAELKKECVARGEKFSSETDSEVIAHLVNRYYRGDLAAALRACVQRLTGSYAIAALAADSLDTIACARQKSPLIVAKNGDGELLLASDIPAVAEEGLRAYTLHDGDIALLKNGEISVFDSTMRRIERDFFVCDAQIATPAKNGYEHFMYKEITEIPFAMRNSMPDFAQDEEFSAFYKVLCQTKYIEIVACGTAYHSGLCAAYAFEKICRIPCRVSLASEYRYRDPIVPESALVLAVSQSGETADTLAAAQLAKERGACLAALTNVPYSSITTIADFVIKTNAGQEIAVAATKSFNAQLATLYAMVQALAAYRGEKVECRDLPALASLSLKASASVRSWTPYFSGAKSVFFLGRGADCFVASEGSLKLKEISYIPSEGYAAGELKHGTLALVDGETAVVAIITQQDVAQKTMNAVHEAYARGAKVFLVTAFPEYGKSKEIVDFVVVPSCEEAFSPALSVIPLQVLAYSVCLACGYDPDKPRNLAKSVTVE